MDPASAIGVASAVLAIVNIIAKNMVSLSDLQLKYNTADLKIGLLIGQLSTVKAALNQIAGLFENDIRALRDPGLIHDFSTSLGCVEAVVVVLDNRISHVHRNADNELTIRSKVNFLWDEKTMDDYLNLLNNQIQALGLLLTAFHCRTAFEQTKVLQNRQSRQIFDRVKDETSSLLWLRDAESARSHHSMVSEDLGTVNATFTFDLEVFNSKVYQAATRSNMIYALFSDREDVPNDAASLAPAPLHDTSITQHTASIGSGDNAGSGKVSASSDKETLTDSSVSCSSDDSRESDRKTPAHYFRPLVRDTIEDEVARLQLPPIPSNLSRICRYYDIYDHKTLGTLTRKSMPQCTPRPRLSWSLAAPEHSGQLKRERGLSAYKQTVSFQRSGLEPVPRPHRFGDAAFCKADNLEVKVLLAGVSDSGKSTLQKSMKIAFGKVDKQWRLSYKPAIYMSLAQSLKALASKTVWHEKRNNGTLDDYSSWYERKFAKSYRVIDEWISATCLGVGEMCSFPSSVASAVVDLSKKSDVRAIYDQMMLDPGLEGKGPFILDCTKHYMTSASRIVDSDYIPTLQDVLWARTKSIGLYESRYILEDTLCRFVDFGGTRAERCKWSRSCKDINAIVFTLDVSCYDQVLAEDTTANSMTEQFSIWDSLVQSECFTATNFIVLFTKVDKLTPSKLQASPFSSMFPGYAGNPDSSEDVLQYLAWRLETASKDWTARRLMFCDAGSIWDSPTNMAEVAVRALTEVENL